MQEDKRDDSRNATRCWIMAIVIFLSVLILGGIYYFLSRPVTFPHDVVAVVKVKCKKQTTCLSRVNLISEPHDIPFLECELVDTKELVSVEVSPYVSPNLSEGDTCVLRCIHGDYVYKNRGSR